MPPKKKAPSKKPRAAEESDEDEYRDDYDDDVYDEDVYDDEETYGGGGGGGYTGRSQASSRSTTARSRSRGFFSAASSSSSSSSSSSAAAAPLTLPSRGGGGGGNGAFTSISKMAIQGIRAFSPNKECTIEFYKPLTMIVGANGCGKTTIIECLKYATTGLSPPGGDKGRFVHDPKIAGMPEVKASIKLRFTNRAGQDMVVIRSLQLTQKKTQSTFKTLDGVIKQTNPETGEKTAMSHKCGELDKLIPNLMGVSKSIMENVIFCHQEDSSWPLGDPASLKKKFDDIFESSRYSKALETIRKTKLEYTNKAKEMKVELASLDAYREQAEVIQQDLDKLNKSMERYEGRESKFNADLAEVAAEIEVHRQNERKAREKLGQVESRQRALNERKAVLAEKESNLGDALNLEQGEAAIREKMEALEEEASRSTSDLGQLRSKLASCEKRQMTAHAELSTMLDSQGALKAELAREQETVDERFQLGSSIGTEFGLGSFPSTPASGEYGDASYVHKVDSFTGALRDAEMARQTDLMTAESAFDEQAKSLSGESLTVQKQLAEMEGRLKHQEDTCRKLDTECEEVSVQINQMGRVRTATRQLEEAKKRKDDLAEDIERLKTLPRNSQLNTEIRDADKAIKELTGDISEYRQAAENMEGRKTEEDKLRLAEDQAEDAIHELQQKVDAKRTVFRDLEGGKLELSAQSLRSHRAQLVARRQSAQESEETAKRKHNDAERLLLQKETTLDGLKQSLSKARQQLSTLDPPGAQSVASRTAEMVAQANAYREQYENEETVGETIVAWPDNKSLEEVDEWAKTTEQDVKELVTNAKLNSQWAARLLKKAEKKRKCGCCDRLMNEAEFQVFKKRMSAMVSENDDASEELEQLERVKALSTSCTEALKAAGDAAVARDQVQGLENDVSDLEGEVERLRASAASLASELEEASAVRDQVEGLDDEVGKVLAEFSELTRRKDDAVERRERLQSQMDPLSASEHLPRSLSALKFDLRAKEDQREKLTEKVRDLNDEKMKVLSRLQSMEQQYRSVYEEFDKLESASNKLKELETKREALRTELEALQNSRSQLKKEIAPKQSEVDDKQAMMETLTAKWKQDEQRLRKAHNVVAKALTDLDRLNNQVSAGVKRNTPNRLREMLEASGLQQGKIERYGDKVSEYKAAIGKATEVGAAHEKELKEARDNLAVLQVREEVATLGEELERLKEVVRQANEQAALGSQGQALRTWQQCERDKSQLEQDRAENRGKMATLERQLGDLKQRLKEPNYRGVKERTRAKRVELETTNMAVEDLEKYWGALDKALLRFHGQKISDINRIIRELWQRTYCGEDIDGIEIVSGEEGGSTRAARSYNYRVVMRKGETALDMRGRCSAGQRVLACIVIRLALAETFCLSCGILTLDEPTTNLDEYNKTGLANALAEIISVRAKQRNFQLVVITHDADFVTHMRDAFNSLGADRSFNLPEYYWRISRNQTGHNGQYCSEIHRTDWDDM